MKKDNIYTILILQAVLTLLLFFSEDVWKYVTIGLFCLMDIFILVSLVRRTWSYSEPYIFATLITSILFLIFYSYNPTAITIVLGIGLMFIFLISAMLAYKSKKSSYPQELPTPAKPLMQTYELEEFDKELDHLERERRDYGRIELEYQKNRELIERKQKEESQYQAKALAYELEREAAELKRAENYISKKNIELTEDELLREADSLEKAEKQIRKATLRQKKDSITKQVKALQDAEEQIKKATLQQKKHSADRQVKALQDAEKEIEKMKLIQTEKELQRQAKELENAEKKLRETEFLNKQKEITRQALELAKAQAQINNVAKSKQAKSAKTATKTFTKTVKNEAVFATKTGNSFHETGCMIIKKIPKKNLILFNTHKEALKKGYKPCNVCKP